MTNTHTPELRSMQQATATSAAEQATDRSRVRLHLVRGTVAIVWAAIFAAVADSLTVGAGVLVVIYPLIDAAASLIDADHTPHGRARHVQLVNAATSTGAAVGLAIAATGTASDVLHVFGAWAIVSGAIQIVVALHRRSTGSQWPMLAAGGLSVLVGAYYNLTDQELSILAVYATGGGIWFILQAATATRRRRSTRAA